MRARSGYASGLQALSLLLATACFGVGRGIAPAPAQNASLELQDIMHRIELGMLAVSPCSNADIYFSEAVKPHRLGAVDMCSWMLEHGSNPTLLNISATVYSAPTEDDIYQMRLQLPECPLAPSPAPSPDTVRQPRSMAAGIVSSSPAVAIRSSMPMIPPAPLNGNYDHDFALQMIAHHWVSMNMARVEVKRGTHQPLKALATQLIVVQTLQVEQMRSVLSRDFSTFV